MVVRLFLVAFAGALGTVARYVVGLWATRTYGATFPYGTLIVNLVGCFAIAFVAQLAASTTLVSSAA
jgi:fluoride exporter